MTTCTAVIPLPVAGEPVDKCPLCKKPWAACFCGGRLRVCPIVASEDSWDRGPCPMTDQNSCPSDPAQQAKCTQC